MGCCPSWGRLTHPACQHPQGQSSFSQPQWEGSRLIQMPRGQTRSGTAETPWHTGGPDPPRQREELCVPQTSPIPCQDSVTRHLRAQKHKGSPECCHISPGDSHPWHSHRMSEKGGARHREQEPGALLPSSNLWYQQPHSRTPTTRDGAEDCRGRAAPQLGHCLQPRESPVQPLPFPCAAHL